MNTLRHRLCATSLILIASFGTPAQTVLAATGAELNVAGKAALDRLYAQSDRARRLRGQAS
jgi:hypothetical protein